MLYLLGVLTGLAVSCLVWEVRYRAQHRVMVRDLEERQRRYKRVLLHDWKDRLVLEKPETPPAWEERS